VAAAAKEESINSWIVHTLRSGVEEDGELLSADQRLLEAARGV
jgi:hypothetical protein